MAHEGARQALINKNDRGKRSSSTAGNNNGRPPKIRVGCPMCSPPPGDTSLYTGCGADARTITCKNGHTFPVGGHSYLGDKSPFRE